MFRKPKKKPSALRNSGGSGATTSTTSSGFKQANKKKRPRQTRDSSSSSDEDNNDDDNDGANNTSDLLQQIRHERINSDNKKTKSLLNTSGTTKHKKSSGMMHQYKSSNVQLSAKEMATRTAEYHPANDNDNNSKDDDDNDNSDKAQNAALPSLQKVAHNPFHAGPLKATTFVRTTARFDYQPDICKDYKETGFCGFGDTCIYLHDRGDTKSGWQMEQEYEERKRGEEERKGREMERFMNSMMCGEVSGGGGGVKKKKSGDDDYFGKNKEDDAKNANDGIPYACHICRGPFQNPVVTTCGHYYCESCMQTRIRESGLTTCPICQKDTHGVLNHAQKLVAKKRRLVGRDGSWEDYLAKK
ncbi:putative zinc finger protein [Skeletonema marinoi]|uniref:Zinc finger protein n=1 Tax=Skeletonema marinoi TaxID=267567 RepID=A0AAD9D4A0_9STRA|nr:putative zinc finger protein [Skeletonema marinoi]